MTSPIDRTAVAELRRAIEGRVYAPRDAGYGRTLRGRGTTPTAGRRPAVIVQAQSATDVASAIGFARGHALELSVRCGGHDMLGASTSTTGVLLDLSPMDRVEFDSAARVCHAGGGVRSGALFAAGRFHGLAPVLGMSPDVGLGGLVLGGGIGWLAGSHGAAVDHLLSAEVVTADGRIVEADSENHPDLFWALCGGGNFGVATRLTLRLQPVREVLAGSMRVAADPGRVLPFLRAFLGESDDALDMETSFTLAPNPTATFRLCWSGDVAEGERKVAALRHVAPVLADDVAVRPFADFVADYPHAETLFLRGGELAGLDDLAIEAIAQIVARGGPAGCTVGVLHYMHGAICRPPAETPFVRPEGHILYNVVAPSEFAEAEPEGIAWAEATWRMLTLVSSARTYPNYLCDDSRKAVERSYGPHIDRLRAIKRRYDPDNVFSGNRNIEP